MTDPEQQREMARRVIRSTAAALRGLMSEVEDEPEVVRFGDIAVGVEVGLQLARYHPEFAAALVDALDNGEDETPRRFCADIVSGYPIEGGEITRRQAMTYRPEMNGWSGDG